MERDITGTQLVTCFGRSRDSAGGCHSWGPMPRQGYPEGLWSMEEPM